MHAHASNILMLSVCAFAHVFMGGRLQLTLAAWSFRTTAQPPIPAPSKSALGVYLLSEILPGNTSFSSPKLQNILLGCFVS